MKLFDYLQLAINSAASDLTLTIGSPPVMRVNGQLNFTTLPNLTTSDIEEMLNNAIGKDKTSFSEKKGETIFAISIPGLGRFRFNIYYQRAMPVINIRILMKEIENFEELNIPIILKELCKKEKGLILVTGGISSGKSTTIASMIEFINNSSKKKITTIESPVEYLYGNKNSFIEEIDIPSDISSFEDAVEFVLRQDTEVVYAGDINNRNRFEAVIRLAEAGLLVFATMNAQGVMGTINRYSGIASKGFDPNTAARFAEVFEAVISHKLLPAKKGNKRVLLSEVLLTTPSVKNLIKNGDTNQIYSIMETGKTMGMQTFDASVEAAYKSGVLRLEDAISIFSNPQKFMDKYS